MMIQVFKIGTIVLGGIFAAGLTNILLTMLLKLVGKIRGSAGSVCETTSKKQKADIIKDIVNTLLENSSSKKSLKIRLFVSAIILALSFILSLNILFSLICGASVFFGIGAYYSRKYKANMDLFNDQLIEALGRITNSLRAGQSFVQAFENLVTDSKPPLSSEFGSALNKIKLGTPVSEALFELTYKIKSSDLRISVLSINLARESGGNMGEILSRIAETMRERKKINGKIASLTAQGKASAIVMGFVPFVLLAVLYFIQPNIMGLLFSTFLGNMMLFTVVIMITVGMIVINKIVSIDI